MVGERPSVRSTATILFTDLVGSTAQRAALGEDAADELRRVHDRLLGAAITGQAGRVVKGGGDGLVATFPSAADGLAAAVAGQRAIERFNLQPNRPAHLSVRMGLSTGDVTFEDGDVFGMPVIEAARLEGAAEGGQILCTEILRVLARGRGAERVEPIGFLDLKGLPEPLATCEVGWAAEPADTPALPAELALEAAKPLVGRSDQLEAIDEVLDRADSGAGLQVVWLSGEPGIGKTRLAAESARRALERGHRVLFGRCSEDLGVPYQPFVEALAAFVAGLDDDDLAGRLGPGGSHLARLVPELVERVPQLAAPPSTTPEADQYRLFEAVRRWVSGLGPAMVVVDDIHWATGPTQALLGHLGRSNEPGGAVLLCTARDTAPDRTEAQRDLLADLDRAGRLRLIRLDGLSAAETAELVGDPERGRGLHAETAGNPLFITTYQAEQAGTTAVGVAGIVRRRLSRLPAGVVQALEAASVAGLQFELPVLALALDEPERAVLDALDLACAAALTEETGPDRYQFTHALVRAALLAGLSATRRARLHGAIARGLETLLGERAGERAAELAHHFAEALPTVEPEVAGHYAELAGRRAVELFSFTEAATLFRFAAEHTAPTEPTLRIDRLVAAGRAWRDASGYEEAFGALGEAVDDALARSDAARAVDASVLYSDIAWRPGIPDPRAVAQLERALAITSDGDLALRAAALSALGISRYLISGAGQEPAALALALARELDDRRLLGDVLARQGLVFHDRPADHDALLASGVEVEAIAGELDDDQLLMVAVSQQITAEVTRGRFDMAQTGLERLRRLVERNHDQFWAHGVVGMTLTDAWRRGDLDEVERLQSTIESADARWRPPAGLEALRTFLLRREQDRLGEVAPLLDHIMATAPPAGLWTAGLAVLLADLGRVEDARRRIGSLLGDDGRLCLPVDGMIDLNAAFLAEAAFIARDPRPAPALVAAFEPLGGLVLEIHGGVGCLGPADRFLGLAAAAAEDLALARSAFESAAALCRRVEAPLWLVDCLCDLAEATGDSAPLTEARRVAAGHDWPRLHRRVTQFEGR